MPVTFTYTLQNKNSQYEEVGLGTPDPLTTLEPIYGNKEWSFDMVFAGTYDNGQQIDPIVITRIITILGRGSNSSFANLNAIKATGPAGVPVIVNGVTYYSISGNTITLYKAPGEGMFPGEKYRFIDFYNQTESEYENVSNLPPGLSVIGWDTPIHEEVTYDLAFAIEFDVPNQNIIAVADAYVLGFTLVWDFEEGWNILQQQVANSET